MSHYIEMTVSAQNAYADLFSAALSLSITSSIAGLNGSFGKKLVKGKNYYYFQYRDIDGKVVQLYAGPESEKLKELIKSHNSFTGKPIEQLSKAAIALGCEPMIPKHFRLIKRLSEYGFFKSGGILVGTHGYMSILNMLGITTPENMQTQDVDFAHAGKNISISMPSNIKIKIESALKSLEMGLLPIATVEGKFGASYLNPSDPSFRVDFLTSKNSEEDAPVYIEGLSIALQPLKFMEFSMIDTVQSVAISEGGATVVNIPKPDRFSIHKLIVSAERSVIETAKINKDIRQANVIIQYYIDNRPEDLIATYNEAISNGPGWKKRLDEGVIKLSKINKEAALFLTNSIDLKNKNKLYKS